MNDLFLHYEGYKPPTAEQRKAEEDRKTAQRHAKRAQAAADLEAKRIAKKAAKHQENLENFREKVGNSNWPEDEKASLIAKSYLW